MRDEDKTKEELIYELSESRKYNTQLKEREVCLNQTINTLLKRNNRHQPLYENASFGYHSLDTNGNILEVNKAWLDLLGYSRDEVIGKWFGDFLAPEYRQGFKTNFPFFQTNGQIYDAEYMMIHKDGSHLFILLDGSIGYDEQGNFQQTHCILHDMTEPKQLEEELRKYQVHLEELVQEQTNKLRTSNEQLSFASALNLIAETIISNDDMPNILQTMVKIVGSTLRVDRSLIYDIDFAKHLAIGECEWLNPNTPDVISAKVTFSLDLFIDACTYLKKYRHWLESHIDNYSPYALCDGSGDILHKNMQIKSGFWYPFSFREQGYYCLVFHQVDHRRIWRKEEIGFIASVAKLVEIAIQKINFLAEQKRHEEALRLSEERFYKVFHHSPISLTIFSLESGKFIDANECCLKMHGYTRDEFIVRTAVELDLWVDMNERAKYYQELEETGFAHNHEIESYKKSGEIFDALFSGVVIDLNSEKCVLGAKTDITELRQYQRELSRLDSLNLIGEMAAGIAHEIRNPMTTVKGFLQLLGEKKEYKQHEHFFALMTSELDRANSIITEFLSLVKNKPVDLKSLNLNLIIENLFPLIQADAMVADKYVDLELNRIENLLADGKEMRQLILNLVRNGFEAMSPGGKLTIKTYMKSNTVVLVIQDQGKGIDFNAIDKIGTPFFTTKDNGTGLGLATCYSIADRHNALINFDTGPTGTTFYVCFNAC